jgi:2-polyprenyl-6-methoxyphenol hydroxylase-like FAD-dependent oxidoreductase
VAEGDRVLIVGAGIAGLGLARALSRARVDCRLAERAAGLPAPGMGINLPGNAVRMLDELGVRDEVLRHGAPIRRREYRNSKGRLLFAVDEESFWSGVATSVCVRRGDLVRILADGLDPRWGTRIVSVEPGDTDVRIRLEDGREENYGFVVGADGVNSTVRAAVTEQAVTRASRMTQSSWRFVVPNPGVDCWVVWTSSRGTFLLIPLPGDLVYGYASSSRSGAPGGDASWLSGTFDGFPAPVGAAVSSALEDGAELRHSPVEEVDSPSWARGRIAVIGDAAHATGPVWAQGAALALEDGVVLADLLARRSDWSGVGAAFEQVRRPRVEHVRRFTDRMSKIAALPDWVRDLTTPFAGPRTYRETYEPLRRPPARP